MKRIYINPHGKEVSIRQDTEAAYRRSLDLVFIEDSFPSPFFDFYVSMTLFVFYKYHTGNAVIKTL